MSMCSCFGPWKPRKRVTIAAGTSSGKIAADIRPSEEIKHGKSTSFEYDSALILNLRRVYAWTFDSWSFTHRFRTHNSTKWKHRIDRTEESAKKDLTFKRFWRDEDTHTISKSKYGQFQIFPSISIQQIIENEDLILYVENISKLKGETLRRPHSRPMSEEDEQFERLMETNFANKLTGKMEFIYMEEQMNRTVNIPFYRHSFLNKWTLKDVQAWTSLINFISCIFQMGDTPVSFEHLPVEIIHHIMNYLDAFSLVQASLVCTAWRSLTIEKRLWMGKRKARKWYGSTLWNHLLFITFIFGCHCDHYFKINSLCIFKYNKIYPSTLVCSLKFSNESLILCTRFAQQQTLCSVSIYRFLTGTRSFTSKIDAHICWQSRTRHTKTRRGTYRGSARFDTGPNCWRHTNLKLPNLVDIF